MKTSKTLVRGAADFPRALLLVMLAAVSGAARPADALAGEELAVIQAMAAILNADAGESYDYLYFESDFSASPIVASSMANPDRTQYCGLSREKAQALVGELTMVNQKPLVFDSAVAKPAGLRIGHKKLPRFRYLMLSRVVFAPGQQQAWMAVDLNGATGAVMRLDKVGGQWNKAARCGGWVRSE